MSLRPDHARLLAALRLCSVSWGRAYILARGPLTDSARQSDLRTLRRAVEALPEGERAALAALFAAEGVEG